jgi:hypothetical protein
MHPEVRRSRPAEKPPFFGITGKPARQIQAPLRGFNLFGRQSWQCIYAYPPPPVLWVQGIWFLYVTDMDAL